MSESSQEFTLTFVSLSLHYQFFRLAYKMKLEKISKRSPLDLGRLMASTCRQKIIATLATVKQTHIMDLVRKVNSTYTQVNRNLQILEQEDIVESRHYGRMRVIRLNRENPKTKTILKALRILRSSEFAEWK